MRTTLMISPMRNMRAAFAGAFAVAAALSSGAASAQGAASCKQEYAARKAAGEVGGQTQASYVKACVAMAGTTPVPPAHGGPPGGGAAEVSGSDSSDDLAKQLANPIANLISVPLQNNLDYGGGPKRSGSQYILNIQPVIPFKLNDDWNLITRTIVPVTDVVNIIPGNPVGIGDTVQSFFLSPAQPVNGIILGAGPVFLYPTATRDEISANQWGAGPTFVGLTQSNGYTVGILANHIWGIGPPGMNGLGGGSILGDDGSTIPVPPGRSPVINATYLQPFASYTFPSQTTLNLSSESTYNWTAGTWTVPLVAGVTQILKVGGQPISVGLFGKYYVVRPDGAPAWGLRFALTFLFPK